MPDTKAKSAGTAPKKATEKARARGNAEAIEDYLKTIYGHTEWQPDPITPSALAGKLGLAPSTVTEMVAKLREQGLVEHARYGSISLTEAGRERALQVVRRHRLIEAYLVTVLGYGWDEVHEEAEVLEHAVSDRFLDAIDEQLDYPDRDPHGDPIPSANGWVRHHPAVLLGTVDDRLSGTVLRISDKDPSVLRLLDDMQIGLGTELTVIGGADAVEIAGVAGVYVDLTEAADAIWIAERASR